jgi:tRNA(fMet)-specific endonuclease VapC
MSLHILATDTLTLFQDGHPTICQHATAQPPDELAITVLSVEEQLSGSQRDRLAWAYRRLAQNVRFLSRLQIVAFEEPAIRRYEGLIRLKLNVRKMDLRIAAAALECGATLVTRNARDFKLVPHLVIADWSK